MEFSVWAPRPRSVELVVDGTRVAMHRGDDGWWTAVADAAEGSRYGFVLDGGTARPDPRALRQPDGIDGLSAVYDHARFEWHDTGWPGLTLAGRVLYELHVGTFSPEGDFDGAAARLPRLVELGVDAVELMPVVTASGRRGWGYDGVDLFAVSESYGGPDALKRFVDEAHRLGLGVVVDVVYNHLGPAGNYLPEFGPYFTDRHQTPWGDAVNFDAEGSEEVRRFVVDNAVAWLRDFHADGLRLDAVHAIFDESSTHILEEIGAAVHALGKDVGRPLFVIAENETLDPGIVTPAPHGYGLDAVWSDDWHHALHALLTGERDGYYEPFGTGEDLVRAIEHRWSGDLPADRFVIAAQNHDQVGNRARGERLSMLVSAGRARIAATLLLTAPFVPMLFAGEEWSASTPFLYFTDHQDPALADAVRDGRRDEFAAFGWGPDEVPDPQAPETFEQSKLRWDEIGAPAHRDMLEWYRRLIALRRAEPDLSNPAVRAQARYDAGVLTMVRGTVRVMANLGTEPRAVELDDRAHVLLADAQSSQRDGKLCIAPDGVAVIKDR